MLQLCSPALPTGAFAYSQGMEFAVEQRWITDRSSALHWVSGLLASSVARLELPVFLRLHDSARRMRPGRFSFWEEFLIAGRETKELRAEEQNCGRSLQRIALDLIEHERTQHERASYEHAGEQALLTATTYAGAFAATCVAFGIGPEDGAHGYSWLWCEQRSAALVRLIPLGQTDGQKLLMDAAREIPEIIAKAKGVRAADIGASLPAATLASMRHETQYTRIFLS